MLHHCRQPQRPFTAAGAARHSSTQPAGWRSWAAAPPPPPSWQALRSTNCTNRLRLHHRAWQACSTHIYPNRYHTSQKRRGPTSKGIPRGKGGATRAPLAPATQAGNTGRQAYPHIYLSAASPGEGHTRSCSPRDPSHGPAAPLINPGSSTGIVLYNRT